MRGHDVGHGRELSVFLLSGQSMADFLDDDDEELGSAGGTKPSQKRGGKPPAKRKVRCQHLVMHRGVLDGVAASCAGPVIAVVA